MLKKEVIYREILTKVLEEKQFSFTQLSLSKKFGFSLSTISNALKPLEQAGAVEKKKRSFSLIDARKALAFWATARRLNKDIVYSTRSSLPVRKIEGSMPPGSVFTAYSGYRFLFEDAPADYGEVYLYADQETQKELEERFPKKEGPPNIFVLQKDSFMPKADIAPIAQIYVDLWNLKEWYARDFLDALERRLFE